MIIKTFLFTGRCQVLLILKERRLDFKSKMNDCLVISNGYCIKAQNKCGRRGLYYTVGNITVTICIKKNELLNMNI